MGLDVTVVVGTFGQRKWSQLAERRAIPSAMAQDVGVVHSHGDTLHEARNNGLEQVETEWVCHLDADDELEDGFFEAMATGVADLRAPSVRYIREGFAEPESEPYVPKVAGHTHACRAKCLLAGNWLVVGSLVRTDIVRTVGGWREFAMYEDYDLWLRCYLAGSSIEAVPEAVYRAHSRSDSRNRAPGQDVKLATHRAIAVANGIPAP